MADHAVPVSADGSRSRCCRTPSRRNGRVRNYSCEMSLPEIRHKFQQLEKLTPRAQRAEVGSGRALINACSARRRHCSCRGGFDLGAFLQQKGS